MTKQMARALLTTSSLAVLLALGACGDRVQVTAQQDRPSVEINRQGEPGARPDSEEARVATDTNAVGASAEDASSADARIATDVKRALATDPDLSGMKIDVSSEDGAVTLRGRAPDAEARERATGLARTVRQVKSVENQLTLG